MLFAVAGLLAIGAAFIYSATSGRLIGSGIEWYEERYVRQLFAGVLGLVLAFGICLVDYQIIARWSLVIYWFSIALLLLVLVLPPVAGVHRWIPLGFLNFQPSELAKISVICLLGNFLSRPTDELRFPIIFVKALGMILLPFCLILIGNSTIAGPGFGDCAVADWFCHDVCGRDSVVVSGARHSLWLLCRGLGSGGCLVCSEEVSGH